MKAVERVARWRPAKVLQRAKAMCTPIEEQAHDALAHGKTDRLNRLGSGKIACATETNAGGRHAFLGGCESADSFCIRSCGEALQHSTLLAHTKSPSSIQHNHGYWLTGLHHGTIEPRGTRPCMLAAALLLSTASSQAIPKLLGVSGSCVGHDVLDRAHVEQGAAKPAYRWPRGKRILRRGHGRRSASARRKVRRPGFARKQLTSCSTSQPSKAR